MSLSRLQLKGWKPKGFQAVAASVSRPPASSRHFSVAGNRFAQTGGEVGRHVPVEVLPENSVLIVGGGPVGLCLATTLAHYGVRSVVVERNESTTKWPKMDLTNVRSMELFRRLGLAQSLREQGVATHLPYPVTFTTGLSQKEPITRWNLKGVDEWRLDIANQNDGSMPLEPYQRLSQAVFEKWLKAKADANPLIDCRFNHRTDRVVDLNGRVRTTITNQATGQTQEIISKYVAGCDGASSQVRRSLEIPLEGGPTPAFVLLIHFKSTDLTALHSQGRFWHAFILGEKGLSAACIAQNEIDTWTTHLWLGMDQDPDKITSQEAVEVALGGMHGRYPIKIDEVLVRSTYRPSIAVAKNYSGFNGHVFLAGDSAHQNIPTGGYGMNMGIADSFELGWRLATVINGFGGRGLLEAYEPERRMVATNSVERSGVHTKVHMDVAEIAKQHPGALGTDTEEGKILHKKIHDHYQKHDGENKDTGIEMGYNYQSNIIIRDDATPPEPTPHKYKPTTYPGSRAPHVYLRNGTPIFDHYGTYFTLVDFVGARDRGSELLVQAAEELWVPLKHLRLEEEENAARVWEKGLVLVRPDGHVSWRADGIADLEEAKQIITTIAGLVDGRNAEGVQTSASDESKPALKFTSVINGGVQKTEYKMDRMGDFQK